MGGLFDIEQNGWISSMSPWPMTLTLDFQGENLK